MKRLCGIWMLICGCCWGSQAPAQDIWVRSSEVSIGSSFKGSAISQVSVFPFRIGVHEFNLLNYEMVAFPNGAFMESWRPEYRRHFPIAPSFTFAPSIGISTNLNNRFCPIVGASLVYDVGTKQFPVPLRMFAEYRAHPYTQDALNANGMGVEDPYSQAHKICIGFSVTLNLEMGLLMANWLIQSKAYDWDSPGWSNGQHRSRSGSSSGSKGSSGSKDDFSGHRNR